ncbi:hypothetical protein ADICYQ_3425 [Cyclobacterium qasimii M12-11B]|uniref:Uncharacterized protein n=1 Tax=Cyclobacterium qasimii M12-11B TaxID=641524 RepID=S7VBQ1_9BACT|nr:hypothetical protein ADICYQ_3425 [Cyclobacterium qasimii M12-11B]
MQIKENQTILKKTLKSIIYYIVKILGIMGPFKLKPILIQGFYN